MTTPPPDDVLLRTLATACGWTIERNANGAYNVIHAGRLYDYDYSEADAERKLIHAVRGLLTSVDAALALPWPADGQLLIYHVGTHNYVRLGIPAPTKTLSSYDASGDELARALCETFYLWWTATHQEAPTDVNDERRLP